jgi:hypothetical protein
MSTDRNTPAVPSAAVAYASSRQASSPRATTSVISYDRIDLVGHPLQHLGPGQ